MFVTYAEPGGIGMSSIVGLIAPTSRGASHGQYIVFAPPDQASIVLTAPLAPGLMEKVGIERVEQLEFEQPIFIGASAGSIAFDGEREICFSEEDQISITLREAAFRTIDVACCMDHAAAEGLFVEAGHSKQ